MSYPSSEWGLDELLEDDFTRTRRDPHPPRFASSSDEVTGSIQVHPTFAADLTPELPRVPDEWYVQTNVMPRNLPAAPAPERLPPPPQEPSFPSPALAPFVSMPSEISLPLPRPRLDSDVNTRKKTIPALRRMVGVPVMSEWQVEPIAAPSTAPPPVITEVTRRARGWSPILLGAMAVSLVAMVVMSIVGLGSKARDVARAAHTRDISASGGDGAPITDARVFVDGATVCESLPCTLELADGVHWITVRAPGYETPPSRSVTAGNDEPTAVHFELAASADRAAAAAPSPAVPSEDTAALVAAPEPPLDRAPEPAPAPPVAAPVSHAAASLGGGFVAWARLNINAIPAANVVVDGRPVGRTPVMGLKVRPGAHSVLLIGPDGSRAVRGTNVAAGATATVAARL